MAGEIAGRPHWEVGFDERGNPDPGEAVALLAELPGKDLTDLFVFSHGWNSDRGQARRLYQLYFQEVPGLLAQGGSQARVGTLGVVWPSKRWADEPGSRTSRTSSRATTSAGPWTSWPGCWPPGPRTRPPWPGSRP